MTIKLSDGFLATLNSERFRKWNFISPEQVLAYWNFTVRTVDEYEYEAGISPSQKRGGYLLEEIIRIKFRDKKDKPYDDFFRRHLNGGSGFSFYLNPDPIDNVPATYASLNQLQCELEKPGNRLIYSSMARLLEYGVRIVHEDTHHHYDAFEEGSNAAYSNLLKMKGQEPDIKKALEALGKLEEAYVHVIQGDFASYFLYRLLQFGVLPHIMPFYRVQFPPMEETIQIVGDGRTLLHLGEDENINFKLVWDAPMLPGKDVMLEVAEEQFKGWQLDVNKVNSYDRKGFVNSTTKTLSEIVLLGPEKLDENAVWNMARKRLEEPK